MASCAVFLMGAWAAADTSALHPAYLHALADLRYARAHLNSEAANAQVDADEASAVSQIDAAIRDVKDASDDDGKPMSDHPPVDARWSRTERLHRALELLDKADTDIDEREQDSYWKGLKANSALHHVDEAKKAIQHALAERHE